MSSDWKLYIGFQLEVARAIMSRTGWLDVLTANAGALHSEKWTSQKLTYRSVFNIHAKVPHLLN